MSELYPIPNYELEDIQTLERKPEQPLFAQDFIDQFSMMQGGLEDFFDVTIKECQGNWRKIFALMQKNTDDEKAMISDELERPLLPVESETFVAVWGMGEAIRQIEERRELNKLRKDADSNEIKQIDYRINNLNRISAEWQNLVARMMFDLEKIPEGINFLKFFWGKFEQLCQARYPNDPEQVSSIKNGIFGLKAAIETMEKFGWEAYLSFPEQDAWQKIDLWAVKGKKILAIQVKSKKDNFILRGIPVTAFESIHGLSEEEAKDAKTRNTLLTSAREYDKVFQQSGPDARVKALWLEIPVAGAVFDQDPTTGKVAFPGNFHEHKLAEILHEMEVR